MGEQRFCLPVIFLTEWSKKPEFCSDTTNSTVQNRSSGLCLKKVAIHVLWNSSERLPLSDVAWEVRGVAVEHLSAAKWLLVFFSVERRKMGFARMCAAMLPNNYTIVLWNITASHVAVYCTKG